VTQEYPLRLFLQFSQQFKSNISPTYLHIISSRDSLISMKLAYSGLMLSAL